ncbi:PREDICTED: probable leucine-rich repeat receptor-like protein kinase At5g49770 isoform X1 [Populus euphratica]|uniref:non-specific serine/threonine protein kinase n=1 Tax=Populus euphratica TaxID=75702 RepID=A0AAJ6UFH7_POPEU|nr:PREDICTED: probable leucine-rich repeat receptor-like protein kinase At5g49770 isoform X1 [Populus euphratica]
MCPKVLTFLLVASFQIYTETYGDDFTVMSILKDAWVNTPRNWVGADPCEGKWEGISCKKSRVTSITLAAVGLMGELSGDISSLSELEVLDLSYNTRLNGTLPPSIVNLKKLKRLKLAGCSFSGPIPELIGSLQLLEILELNSNRFTGSIPHSIGNLSKLVVLDLFNNLLDGSIPVSSGNTSGLDMLVNALHFHLGRNRFSGAIPNELFRSDMTLIHVLLHDNNLTGSIPSTLGLVHTLQAVRFEGNSLTGPVPSNLNNLINVTTLILSNNKFTGPVPNLTGMAYLSYLDLSNNSFDASDFPLSFSNLRALTTLMLENTGLEGRIPPTLFDLPSLQTLILRNNQLNGTLDVATSSSSQLKVIDMRNNLISFYPESPERRNNLDVILVGNPVCAHPEATENYCAVPQANSSYTRLPEKCVPLHCISDQISSPNCKCSYPYRGVLVFKPPFLESRNSAYYVHLEEESLMRSFKFHQLPVDSVEVNFPAKDSFGYLESNLSMFPSGQDHFNTATISDIGFVLTLQTYENSDIFGPTYFKGSPYPYFDGKPTVSKELSSTVRIIGAAAGGASFLLLLLLAGVCAYRQKKRRESASEQKNHFAYLDLKNSDSVPQLKGARCFSFDEITKCTNNFSEVNHIGSGGYGMVYRGMLPTGQLIAIKRRRQGSVQGGLEFNSEIEVLSRVHHKNVVNLVGFCFERGEQMLIYEFVRNGSLMDSLSGLSGIWLDWRRRLKVALGAARGLAYLHELVNPRIIHRDVKSANILLDESLNAKVADFGLSKPMDNSELILATTQVKGTMGYIDPEYQKTLLLTEKSDVYGFGVVLLELVSGRKPLERGKYLVAEVSSLLDRKKDLYSLHELLDPSIGLDTKPKGLDRIVDLAMKCVQEKGSDRPTMGEVVKEIENILHLAGLNPSAESESTSASFEEASQDEFPPSLKEEEFSLS